MINNRGKKLIQERTAGGPANRTEHFLNLDRGNIYQITSSHLDRVAEFDRDWDHFTEKFGFYDAFGKQLGYSGSKRINQPDYQYYEPQRNDYYQQKRNYGNDEPVYLADQPYYGRVRNSKIYNFLNI